MASRIYDPLIHARTARRVVAMARFMDNAWRIPGTPIRFGIDSLIGLVPGVGDAMTTAVQLAIVYQGYQLGATPKTVAKMVGNVALDAVIGLTPALGDVADVFWKASTRNIALLRAEGVLPAEGITEVRSTEYPSSEYASSDVRRVRNLAM